MKWLARETLLHAANAPLLATLNAAGDHAKLSVVWVGDAPLIFAARQLQKLPSDEAQEAQRCIGYSELELIPQKGYGSRLS